MRIGFIAMRLVRLAAALLCLVVPATAQDEPDILPLMQDYFVCLAGHGAAAMHFQAMSSTDAFAVALSACSAEEAAVRETIPMIVHEEGELNEAQSVQESVLDALNRMDTGYDPTKPKDET